MCPANSLACVNGTELKKHVAMRTTIVGVTAMNSRKPNVSGCKNPTYSEVYTAPDRPVRAHRLSRANASVPPIPSPGALNSQRQPHPSHTVKTDSVPALVELCLKTAIG